MSTGSSDKSSDPPTPQSPGPDPVHDLPEEVLRAGWRRFWSKREKRWYFFNKMTGESLWEMPVVHKSPHNGVPGSDRVTDPLGISVPDTPTDVRSPPPFDLKRRRDSEASVTSLGSMSPSKKMKLEGPVYWNFEIPSNAIIFEHPPCTMPPVHPEAESYRAQLTNKLRSQYQELCQTREGIDAPRESFNRWILERKVTDRGNDPMLPTNCANEISASMYREIMSDIPVRGCRLRHPVEARKYVFKYAEAAKKMVESRNCSSDSRKIVKWSVEDIMQWLRRQNNATLEDYQERLTHLKTQCGPHLTEAAKSSVEGICQKIYHLSCESAKKIYDKHWEILKEHGIEEIQRKFEVHKRRVQCYQIHMVVSCPRLPSISYHVENNVGCLRFKGEVLSLNQNYLQKLEHLYRLHCRDDRPLENFLPRVWCLLRRYQGFADSAHDRRRAPPGRRERSAGGDSPATQTLFGSSPNEGTGLQGALPVPVFEALHKYFGVTFELFASPLNCYFRQYCSAFPDTDGYFGSRGPVLDFHPVSGSFEANPPFSEELLNAMAEHFERLLATSSEPLSFLVFIPEWREPPIPALLKMENSIFKRKTLVVPAYEHEYRSGLQHVCSGSDLYFKSVHGTLVLILQNEAGFAKWGPTDERVKGLLDAYRPQGNPSPSTSSEGRRDSVDGKNATESRSNSKDEKR